MTQAIIVIIDKETKEVLTKIVVGCKGENIDEVIKSIKEKNLQHNDLKSLYLITKLCKFGCEACCVVMDKKEIIFEGVGKLNDTFKNTFKDISFNPRWNFGECKDLKVLEYPYEEDK
jgi:hypothetical protein